MNSVALEKGVLQFWRVSKLALGKGLPDWLKNQPEGNVVSGNDPATPVTPGVGALLRGKSRDAEQTQEVQTEGTTKNTRRWIRWVLWGADLTLIGFCALLTLSRRHPMGLLEVMLCLIAISLGTLLAVIAFLGPTFYWPKE
jgi:hypothetical protein